MGYDILQIAEIDLGDLGDSIQVDMDRSRKVLRISLFNEEHYQDELRIDLAEAFGE